MKHPQKWRETIDPFALPMTRFSLQEVLGYPHAGNDVFHVRGLHEGREVTAYLKAARHQEANLGRESLLLRTLEIPYLPRLLDWDEQGTWNVTEELPGQRLSVILAERAENASLQYLPAYGEMLAWIHRTKGEFPDAPRRRFMDVPDDDFCYRWQLTEVQAWLKAHPRTDGERVFTHGDCHYANLLWEKGTISAVLDWELAGMGDREFDIAWAMLRRPGQRFMVRAEEYEAFLAGYRRLGVYDVQRLRYYLACAMMRFAAIGADDAAYHQWIRAGLAALCRT